MTPMRIAITADPYIPVPPRLYGGIERIVDMIVRGMVARGHHVTLIAHPESTSPAASLRPYGVPPHTTPTARIRELWQVGSALVGLGPAVDIVHSFGRLAALLPILPMRRLPKVQSYQRMIVAWDGVRRAARIGGRSIAFTACSTSVYGPARDAGLAGGDWHTIFNAVNTARFTPQYAVPGDAPLMFLGRVERQKGPHHAIAIARAAGRKLVIAGNVEPSDDAFFRAEVQPAIDNDQVCYVGPVDDARKNDLLGRAAALLMPIECQEAFGIVMAEAMACGTPVIGFPEGSVPEVITDGVTGFIAPGVAAAGAAVRRLPGLDRAAVRRDCENRFEETSIVSQYEDLYRQMIDRAQHAAAPIGYGAARA
jgi:glycosyltransferase involved in cell wall biosynthesis